MSIIGPFRIIMNKIFLVAFLCFILTACEDGGGGTIYTDLCKDHPTNCEVIPEDQRRGGPISNDDSVPPFEEEIEFYTHNDLQDLIRGANNGDTILIDKDLELRGPVVVDKEVSIIKDPSVFGNIKISVINTEAFSVSVNNFSIKNFIVEIENSASFINSSQDFNTGNFLVQNIEVENLVVYVNGVSRFGVNGNNVSIKNSTIIGQAEVPVGFYLADFDGDDFSIEGNLFLDRFQAYEGVVYFSDVINTVVNSNLMMGHADPGYTATLAFFESSNITIENNILQDSNTNRQNIPIDNEDEVNNSAAIGFASIDIMTDNSFVNKYAAYRFILSDLVAIPAGSTNISFGSSVQIPLFSFNQILNIDGSINCDLNNNPAIFNDNQFSNLRQIQNSNKFIPGSNLIPDNCP